MTSVQLEPDVRAGAGRVAELARTMADELAVCDQLPTAIVQASLDAGLYRLCLPAELGGLSVPLPETVSILEQLAHADGSVGWCTVVANAGVSLLAGVDEEQAGIVAADPARLVIAGGFPPTGRVTRTGDTYELTGRWSFASGCSAATWFLGGMMVGPTDDTPTPTPRVAFFPAEHVEIIRNWDVTGLRATGSHDVAVANVGVPVARTTSLFGGPRWSSDPIAAVPFFGLGSLLAAVPLGIAQRAIDELGTLAAERVPMGQAQPLAHDPAFQDQLGSVLARLHAARAFLYQQTNETWQTALAGTVTPAAQAGNALAVGEVVEAALEAVQFAHRAGGTATIRNSNVLARCLNDVMVASRHAGFRPTGRRNAARVVLGLPPE